MYIVIDLPGWYDYRVNPPTPVVLPVPRHTGLVRGLADGMLSSKPLHEAVHLSVPGDIWPVNAIGSPAMGASIADSAFAGSTILLNTCLAAGRTLSSTWFTTHKPSKTRYLAHL